MSVVTPDPRHLTRAVTELGQRRPVVVAKAIYNTQGVKIIDTGVRIDERLYDRLMQHQLTTPLEESVGTEPSVNAAVLRDTALALIDRQPLFARMVAQPVTRDRLLGALDAVPLPTPIAFQLTLMHELHPAQFQHGVACALTAAWLGDEGLATQQDLTQLAAAGLLHDLGMIHVDPVLLQPAIPLQREQRRQLYAHPLVSAMLLERHHDYPRDVIRAVLEHHEALDGSGYPRHLAGDAVTPWGRILALAEMVSAQHTLPPEQFESRLWLQLRMSRHRFDAALVQRLLALLGRSRGGAPTPAAVPLSVSVERLRALQQVLAAWPHALADDAALAAGRRRAVHDVAERCAELLRAIADAGAAASLLDLLEADDGDRVLALELSLLAEEVAWQLRAIGRLARRRWRVAAGEAFPPPLQAWLDGVDGVVAGALVTA